MLMSVIKRYGRSFNAAKCLMSLKDSPFDSNFFLSIWSMPRFSVRRNSIRVYIASLTSLSVLFSHAFPRKDRISSPTPSMADWSELPKELLDLIAKRLDSPFYQLRFRSVCSSWRSSFPSRPRRPLPGRFPFLPYSGIADATWGFHLSRRTVFLIGFSDPGFQTAPRESSWLVKVEEVQPGRMRLLNPLSRFLLNPLPTSFPKAMNLLDLKVLELGQEYVLHYMNFQPFRDSLGDVGNLYMEKVVFMCLGSEETDEDFALLTIHVSGKLAMFKSEDKRWTIIHDMPYPYDDVVLFRGDFYAVDCTGRTVAVGLSLTLSLVAEPVFGGDKKFLVESDGELLLVDMYLSIEDVGVGDGDGDEVADEVCDEYVGERTVRFKVFGLDSEEKRWVEVKSLGDRVLFLGDDCAFSVSASELSSSFTKRNCVLFADNFFSMSGDEGASGGDDVFKGWRVGVFDLDKGTIALLDDFPEYSKLFWPPDWAAATTLAAQNQLDELAL